ncbi:hypothetical protein KPL70_011880 [Citrus sinensis]|nr:hypothetical protein KPL70_011880 [Citrus sinensis]
MYFKYTELGQKETIKAPRERNSRYVDAVMTIPKGSLFPMCAMNLAFNRELIGPAIYFALMGNGQPIGRYDDMWAGCSPKGMHNCIEMPHRALQAGQGKVRASPSLLSDTWRRHGNMD